MLFSAIKIVVRIVKRAMHNSLFNFTHSLRKAGIVHWWLPLKG